MTFRANLILTALALALAGCGESHTGDTDSGIVLTDSGPTVGMDGGGGGVDAGPTTADAGPATLDAGGDGVDAGPVTTTDGGVVMPSDGGAGTIDCMGMTCNAATEQCCVMTSGGGATGSCIPADAMCMGATVVCDGPEDCASGEVCCARGGLGGITVGCEPASDMCGSTLGEFELCNTPADCTDPTDTMCCPVMMGGFSGSYCSNMCFGGAP